MSNEERIAREAEVGFRSRVEVVELNGGQTFVTSLATAKAMVALVDALRKDAATKERVCDSPNRVPICIAPETRDRLRTLLYTPEFHAVGYTQFIERAIARLASPATLEALNTATLLAKSAVANSASHSLLESK